jgi:hypothetical protein
MVYVDKREAVEVEGETAIDLFGVGTLACSVAITIPIA